MREANRKCTSELRVRLPDVEYAQIQNNAARCGLTISDFVRKLLREESLIQKPQQDAIEHFRSLQLFKAELEDVLAGLPVERRGYIVTVLDSLVLEGKRLV